MLSNDMLLPFDNDGNPLQQIHHGNEAHFNNDDMMLARPVTPMSWIQVRNVLSAAGMENIQPNQLSTVKDHYGKIYVHTYERGYGDHWADVTLNGQKMRPMFNVPPAYKKYDGPEYDHTGLVVGWNRVWEIDFSHGGLFYIDQWSINGPHIKPHVSDYLYIL